MSRTVRRMRERVSDKLTDVQANRHQLLDVATVYLLLADSLASAEDCDVEGHAFPEALVEHELSRSLAELHAIGMNAQTLDLAEIRERLQRVDASLQALLPICSDEADPNPRTSPAT